MLLEQITAILEFIAGAFLHMWPYLLVTIPLAVAVKLSGAAQYINRAFSARPVVAVLLATLVGAFSPFCSCGVIPIVAALLIGGVPLAPVMSFWIASPSMDPEAFFLSVSMIGFKLAVWRLLGTLALSLAAGFLTLWIERRGWFGTGYVRAGQVQDAPGMLDLARGAWTALKQRVGAAFGPGVITRARPQVAAGAASDMICCAPLVIQDAAPEAVHAGASCTVAPAAPGSESGCGCGAGGTCSTGAAAEPSFRARLLRETWDASAMVIRFMLLAFFLEALITLYVPDALIVGLVGGENPLAIVTAALLGVPVYTSNLAALPVIGGLLNQGMAEGAALAFLIAGPTTTLPAMAAVWGLVSRRVFAAYVGFALVGAVLLGYGYALVMALL